VEVRSIGSLRATKTIIISLILTGKTGTTAGIFFMVVFGQTRSCQEKDSLTTQGDVYTGSEGAIIVHSIFSPPDNVNVQRLATLSGGNILGRWNHIFSSRYDTTLQVYFDEYRRGGPEVTRSKGLACAQRCNSYSAHLDPSEFFLLLGAARSKPFGPLTKGLPRS
jgi:hypothetical protein